ncbi:hypothetical protein R1flu_027353 [Riccia fluitans]|uniref:Pentatricopeptide repeat-containing protein n=1 Tax=Riccia fluitans TaxID=41844 RepID=A0ABD1XIK1_9MARC
MGLASGTLPFAGLADCQLQVTEASSRHREAAALSQPARGFLAGGQSNFLGRIRWDLGGLNLGNIARNGVGRKLVIVKAQRSKWFKKHNDTSEETVQMVVKVLCKSGESAEVTLDKHGRWLKPPDWFRIMDGLGKRRRWQLALEVFRWIQSQRWYKPDSGYYSKLISIMGKERQYRLAMWLFAEMRKMGCRPDTSLYNSLMGVHLRSDDKEKGFQKAIDLMQDMKVKRSCQPNVVTYNILIRAAAQLGHDEKVEEFFAYMLDADLVPDLYTYNGLIDAYGKAGRIEKMEKAFKRMRDRDKLRPDIVTFNTLIDSYGKAREFSKMETVLVGMSAPRKVGKLQPNVKTFNSVISNYANAGMWEKAEAIFQEMKKAEVQPSSITYEALLGAYGTAGMFIKVKELVKKMMMYGPRPEACTLNRMIECYCLHNMPDEAEALLKNSMAEVGIYPTSSSHGILIRHYKTVGNLARIPPLLDQMNSWGLKPTKQIYTDVLESIGLELDFKVDNKGGEKLELFDSEEDDEQKGNPASDTVSQYIELDGCFDERLLRAIEGLCVKFHQHKGGRLARRCHAMQFLERCSFMPTPSRRVGGSSRAAYGLPHLNFPQMA